MDFKNLTFFQGGAIMLDENGCGTTRNLATLLGITTQRISQLIQEGIIKRKADGGFHFQTAIADYYQWKCGSSDDPQEQYWQEKAIHEKVKRETAEINLAKMQNNVYDAKHVELVMTEILSNLRTQLLGLPSKLAPILENKSRDQVYEKLVKEIEEKLMELSDYSPGLFTEEELEDEISESFS